MNIFHFSTTKTGRVGIRKRNTKKHALIQRWWRFFRSCR